MGSLEEQISISWECIRNANSQTWPWVCWVTIWGTALCVSANPPSEYHAFSVWRPLVHIDPNTLARVCFWKSKAGCFRWEEDQSIISQNWFHVMLVDVRAGVCGHYVWELWVSSLQTFTCWLGFPGSSVVENPSASTGDAGLIPGLGRSSGEGNGNPF